MSTRQPWFELWLLNPQRSTVKPTEKHLGKSHAHVGISKINARSIGLSGQCQTWRFYRPRKVIFELLNFKISTNNILIFLISYISEGLSVYSMQLFELALIMQHSSASPKIKPSETVSLIAKLIMQSSWLARFSGRWCLVSFPWLDWAGF